MKIGDRVTVYSSTSRYNGEVGTIVGTFYSIEMDSIKELKKNDPNCKSSTTILLKETSLLPGGD